MRLAMKYLHDIRKTQGGKGTWKLTREKEESGEKTAKIGVRNLLQVIYLLANIHDVETKHVTVSTDSAADFVSMREPGEF